MVGWGQAFRISLTDLLGTGWALLGLWALGDSGLGSERWEDYVFQYYWHLDFKHALTTEVCQRKLDYMLRVSHLLAAFVSDTTDRVEAIRASPRFWIGADGTYMLEFLSGHITSGATDFLRYDFFLWQLCHSDRDAMDLVPWVISLNLKDEARKPIEKTFRNLIDWINVLHPADLADLGIDSGLGSGDWCSMRTPAGAISSRITCLSPPGRDFREIGAYATLVEGRPLRIMEFLMR